MLDDLQSPDLGSKHSAQRSALISTRQEKHTPPQLLRGALFHLENAPEPKEKGCPPRPVNVLLNSSFAPRTANVLLNSTFLLTHGLYFYPLPANTEWGLIKAMRISYRPSLRDFAPLCISACLTAKEVRCRLHPVTTLTFSYGVRLSPPFSGCINDV